jgi:hypothetical protein
MTNGLRTWDQNTGALTFDSYTDFVLFPQVEQFISGNSQVGSGAGLTLSYPQFQGKKVMPFLTCPYGNYTPSPAATLSCRVSYPGGVPTVSVFVDNNFDPLTGNSLPILDGYLVVMLTGSNQ